MSKETEIRLKKLTSQLADVNRRLKTERMQRKRLESALRQCEKQFITCFQGAGDGVFIADSKGRYIDVNARGAALIGYSRRELLERSIVDIVAEHERARVPGLVALITKGSQVSEWQFLRKDGSMFWGEVNAQLLPDGHAVGILRDITERKRAQEKIRHSEAFLNGII